jgi:septal ring factor EnvC (AmiA/AmiB activator)
MRLLSPATGHIARYWGASDGFVTAKGLSIETAPGGLITAPYGGQVLFAGNFRSYGQILIIDHGGGYASLLAGLGRLDAAVGQRVIAGEPVGAMPSGNSRPVLYFELRWKDQPIDPLPWLSAR